MLEQRNSVAIQRTRVNLFREPFGPLRCHSVLPRFVDAANMM